MGSDTRRSSLPPRLIRAVSLWLATCVVGGVTSAVAESPTPNQTSSAVRFTPGSAGVGDPYFPLEGNGGYDVAHYLLRLVYLPGARWLSGAATITATATQNLSRFDLDLSGMRVGSVQVNGEAADVVRRGPELVVTPSRDLPAGQRFIVRVAYAGTPETIVDSPIEFGSPYGWIYTRDGAFVACAPNAARTWFPSNDHPSDKASFRFTVTVPRGTQVVANGDRAGTTATGATRTFVWRQPKPMATYLATLGIGHWRFHPRPTPEGIPQLVAVDPVLEDEARAGQVIGTTAAITDYWSSVFGAYPFTSTGAIVDSVPRAGITLETQTRPLYPFVPIAGTMAHELAHQWFGDSVSVASWRDIWLNEGSAVFANWLWTEHTGGPSTWHTGRFFYRLYDPTAKLWQIPVADPGRRRMFSRAVYFRGALTLVVLRHEIGDETFFRLLRTWVAQHRYGNGTTREFTTLASRLAGRDLDGFFATWLSKPGRPDVPGW